MPQIKQLSRVLDKSKNSGAINWYPGHMYTGLKAIIGKLNTVDCVVEVHDARIPFLGRNKEFRNQLASIKPHLLVLNKRDLADLSRWKSVERRLNESGDKNVLLTDLSGSSFSFKERGYTTLLQKIIDLINGSERYNRQFAENFKVMIVGIPNVGKSTLINRLRQHHVGRRGEPAKVGSEAGVTRHVHNMIRICSRPPIYSLDTPGILAPSVTKNHDQTKRLALCSTINDRVLKPLDLANYLLQYLNKNDNHTYKYDFEMEHPARDVQDIFDHLKHLPEMPSGLVEEPTVDKVGWHLIKQFRRGCYGKVMFE